jgi:hypothetical protein
MHYKAPNNSLHFIEPEFAHLLPAGCVQITEEEAEQIRIANTPAPIPPTPLEQIRALEAQYADAQAKLTRQSLLALALDKAMTDPAAAGLEREQVHAFLLAGDNGYAALWNLEQLVEALRVQI